jgi:hypothetical protein
MPLNAVTSNTLQKDLRCGALIIGSSACRWRTRHITGSAAQCAAKDSRNPNLSEDAHDQVLDLAQGSATRRLAALPRTWVSLLSASRLDRRGRAREVEGTHKEDATVGIANGAGLPGVEGNPQRSVGIGEHRLPSWP